MAEAIQVPLVHQRRFMQIAEGNLPPIASPFGRFGPLATQMSTGHLRFTLVHFRVRIAPAEIHVSEKATPEGVAFLMVHQRRFEHPTHGLGSRQKVLELQRLQPIFHIVFLIFHSIILLREIQIKQKNV